MTPQGRIDDLTVINFKIFLKNPSLSHFRDEPTLFDESISSFLKPPSTGVATRTATTHPPPLTVSIRFPISPAPVPVGLAAVPATLPPPGLAAARAPLVAFDTADVEAPEPQVLEWLYLPPQNVRFSDNSDESLVYHALLHARTLQDTPTHMKSGEQRLTAEAKPTDWQPWRPLSRLQSSQAISSSALNSFLNDFPRNTSNAFEFQQGPLLASQSSESMPLVDQGNLRFFPTRLSNNADGDSSVDSTRGNSTYLRNSRITVTPESQQAQPSSTDLPKSHDLRLTLPPRDYHEKVIQNKIPPKMRCILLHKPAASSSQLLLSQKRDIIIDSCQRTRILPSSSDMQTDPNIHNTFTNF